MDVMTGTRLADMYMSGDYTPPELDCYVKACATCISKLRPDIVVHRITGDCPSGMLGAPAWNSDKNAVINSIRNYMQIHGMSQGSQYEN